MRFASRVDPPFSGKNASGSVCEHSASVCHARVFSSAASMSAAYAGNTEVDRVYEPVVRDTGPVLRRRHIVLRLVQAPMTRFRVDIITPV